MGDGRIFLKSRRDVSFKKGLSNEPTFGLIHLAGRFLFLRKKNHGFGSGNFFKALNKILSFVEKAHTGLFYLCTTRLQVLGVLF
jgi:hypothetical protein